MTRLLRRPAILLAAGLGLSALAAGPAAAPVESGIAVGARAPIVTVNDIAGKPVDLGRDVG